MTLFEYLDSKNEFNQYDLQDGLPVGCPSAYGVSNSECTDTGCPKCWGRLITSSEKAIIDDYYKKKNS